MADGRRPGRVAVPAATLLAGLGCAAVGGGVRGAPGAAAGIVAVLVVAVFFSSGGLPVQMGAPAGLGIVVLLTNYAFRLGVALLLLALLTGAGWVDRRTVGVSVIVCALVWVNTRVLLLLRGT